MAYGVIGFGTLGQINSTAQVGTTQMTPSGTVWGDCLNEELNEQYQGFYFYNTFKFVATLPGMPGAGGTFAKGSGDDSSCQISFTSTANGVWTSTIAPVAPGGNTALWFETDVIPAQITAGQSAFVGFATSTGLAAALIATSTTLLSTAGLIGFYMHGDQPANMDAVYQKPLNISSTSTTTITVLASTLTNTVSNPNPGNLAFVPATAPGAFTGSNWVKLGVRVDKYNAYWYVNGNQVAKKAIDTTFDLADSYGGINLWSNLTQSGAQTTKMSFFRVAGKIL